MLLTKRINPMDMALSHRKILQNPRAAQSPGGYWVTHIHWVMFTAETKSNCRRKTGFVPCRQLTRATGLLPSNNPFCSIFIICHMLLRNSSFLTLLPFFVFNNYFFFISPLPFPFILFSQLFTLPQLASFSACFLNLISSLYS